MKKDILTETDLINLNDGLASVEDVRWRELNKHELIGVIHMRRLCGLDERRAQNASLFPQSGKWYKR